MKWLYTRKTAFPLVHPSHHVSNPEPTMKNLTALLLTAAALHLQLPVKAQIELEHTYPDGGINLTGNQLFLLELEVSGWKYVLVDRQQDLVSFYHLDHSFWKSISYDMVTVLNTFPTSGEVFYISEHLFDLDDDIEFLYMDYYPQTEPITVTQIVDEGTGGLIFNVENQAPWVHVNVHQQQYPIQNTPNGTKLILSGTSGTDNNAYVYGLPGELTTGMAETWQADRAGASLNLFPNPASAELTVTLSSLDLAGNMEILSSDGQLQRAETLVAKSTTIPIGELTTGAYICRVRARNGAVVTGSFMKE